MRRGDPATDLVERAIRLWQIHESSDSVPKGPLNEETIDHTARHPQYTAISSVAVGWAAGLLGAIASLGFNIAGAWLMGVEPFRLLRVYATIIAGAAALDASREDFLLSALILHVATGWLFGTVFAIGARWFCCSGLRQYALTGAGFGIAIWLFNFYGILSWFQPLISGDPFILSEIPIAVAALTHISYGMTVALITYPFQRNLQARVPTD